MVARVALMLSLLLVWLVPVSGVRGQFGGSMGGGPDPAELVDVSLTDFAETVRPGETFWVGVKFEIEPSWHIYWRYPGDSGLPTQVDWNLPDGWSAGPIHWPVPERFEMAGGLTNIGYEESVTLLVPITVDEDAKPGESAELTATVRYLVCDDKRCLSADPVERTWMMDVGEATRVAEDKQATLDEILARVPKPVAVDDAAALKPITVAMGEREGEIRVSGDGHRPVALFPVPDDDYELTLDPIRTDGDLRGWSYRVRPFGQADLTDRQLPVVVVWEDGSGKESRQKSVAVELDLGGGR